MPRKANAELAGLAADWWIDRMLEGSRDNGDGGVATGFVKARSRPRPSEDEIRSLREPISKLYEDQLESGEPLDRWGRGEANLWCDYESHVLDEIAAGAGVAYFTFHHGPWKAGCFIDKGRVYGKCGYGSHIIDVETKEKL